MICWLLSEVKGNQNWYGYWKLTTTPHAGVPLLTGGVSSLTFVHTVTLLTVGQDEVAPGQAVIAGLYDLTCPESMLEAWSVCETTPATVAADGAALPQFPQPCATATRAPSRAA